MSDYTPNSNREDYVMRVQALLLQAKELIAEYRDENNDDDSLEPLGDSITAVEMMTGQILAEEGCELEYNPYHEDGTYYP